MDGKVEKHTYFVWEVTQLLWLLFISLFTRNLSFYFFKSLPLFSSGLYGVKLNHYSQSSHFLFPDKWMCVCYLYSRVFMSIITIYRSFLQLSTPLSLIPYNQNNPLTFYSFSFLIQIFPFSFFPFTFFPFTFILQPNKVWKWTRVVACISLKQKTSKFQFQGSVDMWSKINSTKEIQY